MTVLRGLYAITDPRLTPSDGLLEKVEEALAGGAALLQYRNKSASDEQTVRDGKALKQLCHEYGVPLLINDDVELALMLKADGVHIGQTDASVQSARARFGSSGIIGVTCHNKIDLAEKAIQDGASYVALGRFFPSRTKPNAPPCSIDVLRALRKKVSVPIIAIGGITTDNAPQVIEAGADMVAVIHGLFGGNAIRATALAFADLF